MTTAAKPKPSAAAADVSEIQIDRIDDLDCLNLPAEAFKVRGTLVSSVRRSGVMRSTGVYRKVSHKAANGRPAPIYAITPESRTELQTLVGSCADTPGGVKVAESPASSHSVPHVGVASNQNVGHDTGGDGDSGDSSDALGVVSGDLTLTTGQVSGKRDQGRAHSSPAAGSETPDLSEPSLFDDMEEAA
jgi:hypothetical protein